MPRLCLGIDRQYLCMWLGSLLLVPVVAFTQETVPVTVTVTAQFEQAVQQAVGGTGGGNLGVSTISAAGLTSSLTFNQVILPKVETKSERDSQQAALAQRLPRLPRTNGGMFRYEHVDFENGASGLDGDIYATNFQMAWDIENVSVGFLIPYEYLDLRSFNTHQIGSIVYGEYNLRFSPIYALGFIVNGNYVHSFLEHDIEDVNTFGGGVGVSLTMDRDLFVIGGAVSYQYNGDDTSLPNDHQHLIKIGANGGIRLGQNSAVNLFTTWNYDVTDYQQPVSNSDDNYFDLGIELSWSISRTWKLNGGYKRILGLSDFESNQFFIGSLLRF
jgi:hypothetical protein